MPRKHRPVGAGLGEQLARRTHNCKGSVALVFLTMTTKPTFHAKFKPGEGGKTAIYTAVLTHAARRAVVGDRDGDRRSMRGDDGGVRECRDSRW